MKVTAILASHNRRDRTLECLASYYGQQLAPDVELCAVLVDDGSTDGTADAVGAQFPAVEVISGDGSLFWGQAMERAESIALTGAPDCILWLNDDVVLDSEALSGLLALAAECGEDCIIVGAVRDPATGSVTYSGVRRSGLHPLRIELVLPGEQPLEVEMFNGNVVLVPRATSARLGPIDGALGHAAADFDYGLRATRAGIRNLLAPGTIGTCVRDARPRPWLDRSLTAAQRLRLLLGPKGFPPRARARYLMRHGGFAWFLFWLAPYVRAAPSIARPPRSGGSAT